MFIIKLCFLVVEGGNEMKKWKHITFEQRKAISSFIPAPSFTIPLDISLQFFSTFFKRLPYNI